MSTPTQTNELLLEIESLPMGYDEWRVQDPADQSYCMQMNHRDHADPEREIAQWFDDHKKRFPTSRYASYEIAKVRVTTRKEELLLKAAQTIRQLTSIVNVEHAGISEQLSKVMTQCEEQERLLSANASQLRLLQAAVAERDEKWHADTKIFEQQNSTAAALSAQIEQLRKNIEVAYEQGWAACAGWAKQSHLMADINSPAYEQEMHQRLAPHLLGATEAKPAQS